MLYIRTNKREIQYHIGEKKPVFFDETILSIQADEHELLHITQTFRNIPMCTNRVVAWYGEDAQFIIGNW